MGSLYTIDATSLQSRTSEVTVKEVDLHGCVHGSAAWWRAAAVDFETKDGGFGQKTVMSVGPFRQAAQGQSAVERNVVGVIKRRRCSNVGSEGESRLCVERNTT